MSAEINEDAFLFALPCRSLANGAVLNAPQAESLPHAALTD